MDSDSKRYRRAVRRAARTRCQAVATQGFRLLGERVLDLSPRGMLVACDESVSLGEQVIVSFRAPGAQALWMDAEAEIARIINGFRPADPGYCIGLDFTYFERGDRFELLSRLSGCPPPIPQRRLRRAAAPPPELFPLRVCEIVPVGSGQVPLGVFRA
jgi:hypothetical protein